MTDVAETANQPKGQTVPEDRGDVGAATWRDGLGEDLRDDATFARYDSLDSLARAYKDLERYQGRSVAIPRARDGDEAWDKVYARLGRPKDAAGYSAPAIPDGLDVDPSLLERAREAAHRHGLSDRQFRGFVEDVLGHQGERHNASATSREAARQEGDAALKSAWGSRFDGNAEVARRAMRALGFDESLAGDPAALARFFAVGQALGEDSSVIGASRAGFAPSAQEARRRIDAIRGDPDHAFHRGDAPEHAAAVREMEALYALLYDEEPPAA